MEKEIFTTKEGIEVIYQHVKNVNGVVFEIHFKAGGLNDPKGKAGLAHFCEHAIMGFSTDRHTRAERVEGRRKFRSINAYTSNYEVVFWTGTTLNKLDDAVDYLTEGFECIKFDKENFDSEYKIIYDELKTRNKQNKFLLSYIWAHKLSLDPRDNNLEYSLVGSEESLSNITLEDIVKYSHDYFNLENMTINASGAMTKRDLERVISKYIAKRVYKTGKIGFKRGDNLGYSDKPMYCYEKSLEEGKALVNISYQLEKQDYSDYYKREESVFHRVMTKVLSNNANYYFRTTKELCYGCGTQIYRTYNKIMFDFFIQCQQDNVQKVLDEFPEYISNVISEFTEERFEKARETILEGFKFDVSTIWDWADANYREVERYGNLLGNTIKEEDEFYINTYNSVKFEDAVKELEKLKGVKPTIIIISNDEKYKDFDYKNYSKKITFKKIAYK